MKDINATIIIDLKANEEEIMKNLHKDARWGINRARKEGLIVEETDKDEDWGLVYLIFKQTMKEVGFVPIPLKVLKNNTKRLFVCKKDEEIIAGAGIGFVGLYNINTPRLCFNVSLKGYLPLQPNNLL